MGAQRTVAVYVGIFVIAGLTILMWLSLKLEHITIGAQVYRLHAEFDSLLGLQQGNAVTFRGVDVGKIAATAIDPTTGQPRVTLEIETDWPLRENAVARIVQPELFGRRAIDITYPPEGPSGRLLTDGDHIATRPSVDLATALADIGDSIGGTTGDLRGLIQHVDQNQQRAFDAFTSMIEDSRPRVEAILASAEVALPRIEETARTINDVARRVRDGEGTLARLVNDPALADDITVAAASIRDLSERLASGEGTLGRLLRDEALYDDARATASNLREASQGMRDLFADEQGSIARLGALADDLHAAVPDLRETLANMREVTAKINSGEGTIGLLVNDPTLYNELRQALRRIGETFEEAEETGVVRTFLGVFFGAFI